MKRYAKYLITLLISISMASLGWHLPAVAEDFNFYTENLFSCETSAADEPCYETFEVDPDLDGTFTPISEFQGVTIRTTVRTNTGITTQKTALVVSFYYNGSAVLQDIFPTGTPVHLAINTRTWQPPTRNYVNGRVDLIQSEEVNSEWISTYHLRTINNPANGNSILYFIASGFGLVNPTIEDAERVTFLKAFLGNWISSNCGAQASFDKFDFKWTISSNGPALDSEGNPSICFLRAYFPEDAVTLVMGSTPEDMSSNVIGYRQDGKVLTPEEIQVSVVTGDKPGIIVEVPAFSLDSNKEVATLSSLSRKISTYSGNKYNKPKHIIKPKGKLLPAPEIQTVVSLGKNAKIIASAVAGAKSYKGICFSAKGYKVGSSKSPKVVIKNLKKGKWICKIRAVKKTGGYWSAEDSVIIK